MALHRAYRVAVALAALLLLINQQRRRHGPIAPPPTAAPRPQALVAAPAAAPTAAALRSAPRGSDGLAVIVASDEALLPGVVGLVRSARALASKALHFHLLTMDSAGTARVLACFGVANDSATGVSIILVRRQWVDAVLAPRIRVEAAESITGSLSSPLNFVRFFLPDLLPPHVGHGRVLYLDADIVVRGDVHALVAGAQLPRGIAVGAVPRREAHFRISRYQAKCSGLFAERYPDRAFDPSAETFNAGVVVIDLAEWRRLGLSGEALWWMDRHAADVHGGLWHLGSQPILHLMLHQRWHALPPEWNLDGLGRVAHLRPDALHAAQLLHWTGRRKPWRPDGLHTALFHRFVPREEVQHCWRVRPYTPL